MCRNRYPKPTTLHMLYSELMLGHIEHKFRKCESTCASVMRYSESYNMGSRYKSEFEIKFFH